MRKVLLAYGYQQGTTPFYYERALRKLSTLTTAGPSIDVQHKLDFPLPSLAPLLEVIQKVNPDLLLLFPEGKNFFPQDLEKITIPKILILSDLFISFHWHQDYAHLFDLVFITQRKYIKKLQKKGIKHVFWLPNACDLELHQQIPLRRIYDVGFVGTINPWHNPRRSFYLELIKKNFHSCIKTNLWGRAMSRVYSQSKIVFNINGAGDLNMRVFEALSCGALLLTDRPVDSIDLLFQEGEHFISYRSPSGMLNKINFYLQNYKQAQKIASQGQKLVREKHTYLQRVQQIFNTLDANKKIKILPPSETKILLLKTYLKLNYPFLEKEIQKLKNELQKSKLKSKEQLIFLLLSLFSRLKPNYRQRFIQFYKRLRKEYLLELRNWIYYQFKWQRLKK